MVKKFLTIMFASVMHNPQNKSVRVQKNEKVRFGEN